MVFFGIGLLGMALAAALVTRFGPVGGYAIAGAILLLPPLLWAVVTHLSRPRKPPPPANNELTPGAAGRGCQGNTLDRHRRRRAGRRRQLFLNRNKSPK